MREADLKYFREHDVEVHPCDPDKVVCWKLDAEGERTGEHVTCDNLDGLFDSMLIDPPEHGEGIPFTPHERSNSDG